VQRKWAGEEIRVLCTRSFFVSAHFAGVGCPWAITTYRRTVCEERQGGRAASEIAVRIEEGRPYC
jgi:hypothetical protein